MPPSTLDLPVVQLVLSVVAFVAALFFLIFVIVMMSDQWEAITTDTPGVDALQGNYALPDGVRRPLYEGLVKFAFREPFSWRWLLPVPAPDRRPPPPPPFPQAASGVVSPGSASADDGGDRGEDVAAPLLGAKLKE